METLGYETHNTLMNVGSLAICCFLYYVRLFIFCAILRWIPYFKKYSESIRNALVFREILQISTEGYFEFLISGIMNIMYPLTTTNGEVVSLVYGYYSLSMTVVLIPGILLYVFTRDLESIKEKPFHQKWGSLYEEFRQNSKLQAGYMAVFVLRRAVFVAISFLLPFYPWLQITLIIYLNLLIFLYAGSTKPHDSILKNRIEFFNEICIHCASICMLLFTDLMPLQIDHYFIGWGMIGLIYFNIIVNLAIIIRFFVKNFGLFLKKYYFILHNKIVALQRRKKATKYQIKPTYAVSPKIQTQLPQFEEKEPQDEKEP